MGVKFQDTSEIIQKAGRNAYVTSLLKPRVPTESYTRESGDFFSSQAGRAPSCADWQADILGRQPFTLGTQKVRELRSGSFQGAHDPLEQKVIA